MLCEPFWWRQCTWRQNEDEEPELFGSRSMAARGRSVVPTTEMGKRGFQMDSYQEVASRDAF